MDLETTLHSECMVSGVMSFILHVSRIAGTAPVKFERVRGGWRMRLSRFGYIYGMLVTVIIQLFSALSHLYTSDTLVDGYEHPGFMRILTKLLLFVQSTVGITIVFTSSNRLAHTIDCLARLEQINKELDRLFRPIPDGNETRMWFLVLFLLIYGYFGDFLEYVLYMYDVIVENDTVPFKSYAFVATYFFLIHLQLYPMQFLLVVMRLVSTQKRLNSSLKSLLQEISKKTPPILERTSVNKEGLINMSHLTRYYNNNRRTSFIVKKELKTHLIIFRQLANMYCSLCDIIRQLNASNGVPLVMLLMFVAVNLVILPFIVVSTLYRDSSDISNAKALSAIVWSTVSFSLLILTTEPCHRVHDQLYETKDLVAHIMRRSPREASAVNYELKIFRRHILLNQVSFYPMQLFVYDRYIVIAVLTTAVTYLSFVINL